MPKYRVIADSFIDNVYHKIVDGLGTNGKEVIIDYEGEPGPNLQPVDKPAQAVVAAQKATPKAVTDLVAKVRMHAATRGVSPSEANEDDITEVLKVLPQPPSAATLEAVRAAITPAEDAIDLS